MECERRGSESEPCSHFCAPILVLLVRPLPRCQLSSHVRVISAPRHTRVRARLVAVRDHAAPAHASLSRDGASRRSRASIRPARRSSRGAGPSRLVVADSSSLPNRPIRPARRSSRGAGPSRLVVADASSLPNRPTSVLLRFGRPTPVGHPSLTSLAPRRARRRLRRCGPRSASVPTRAPPLGPLNLTPVPREAAATLPPLALVFDATEMHRGVASRLVSRGFPVAWHSNNPDSTRPLRGTRARTPRHAAEIAAYLPRGASRGGAVSPITPPPARDAPPCVPSRRSPPTVPSPIPVSSARANPPPLAARPSPTLRTPSTTPASTMPSATRSSSSSPSAATPRWRRRSNVSSPANAGVPPRTSTVTSSPVPCSSRRDLSPTSPRVARRVGVAARGFASSPPRWTGTPPTRARGRVTRLVRRVARLGARRRRPRDSRVGAYRGGGRRGRSRRGVARASLAPSRDVPATTTASRRFARRAPPPPPSPPNDDA